MAIIYRCDKCHRESEEESSLASLTLTKVDYSKSYFEQAYSQKAICPACMAKVEKLLEPDPIVMQR